MTWGLHFSNISVTCIYVHNSGLEDEIQVKAKYRGALTELQVSTTIRVS